MKDIEFIDCNLCGSNNFSVFYKALEKLNAKDFIKTFSSSGDEVSKDQIVKCGNCELVYTSPRLTEKVIFSGYSEGADETFISQREGRERTFEKRLATVNKYYPNKGKILDIGTAGGSFLYVARKMGWDVNGVEPNKWLCQWSKKNYGLNIFPGTVFNYSFKNNEFDAVSLWDVLEHVHDPQKYLEEVNRILKTGGLLIINYPNIDSLIAKLMGRKWIFILKVHLYYFTPKTIKKYLNKNGFEVLMYKKHFQTLSLGYLIKRIGPYNKTLYNLFSRISKALGTDSLQIPYWLGQTFLIARKK